MGDKVKPWHNRKPKRHDERRDKRPHLRPNEDKKFTSRQEYEEDDYGQWQTDDLSGQDD